MAAKIKWLPKRGYQMYGVYRTHLTNIFIYCDHLSCHHILFTSDNNPCDFGSVIIPLFWILVIACCMLQWNKRLMTICYKLCLHVYMYVFSVSVFPFLFSFEILLCLNGVKFFIYNRYILWVSFVNLNIPI